MVYPLFDHRSHRRLIVLTELQNRGVRDILIACVEQFGDRWDEKYLQISRCWHTHWHNVSTLFRYPDDIRRAIYTTNAIESLNSVIRQAIKKRKLFPTDDSAKKVIFLAIQDASKKMDNADSQLEGGIESFYDCAR